MKRLIVLMMTLSAAAVIASGQQRDDRSAQPQTPEEEIRNMEIGILWARVMPWFRGASIKKVRVPDLRDALAEEYVRIDARGRLFTKQEELENTAGIALPTSRKANVDEIKINIYGNAAVVRSLVTIENEENYDLEDTGRYLVTNVYARREERWLLVSSQWTSAGG